jgi:nucleoid-associated protein YgaU
MINAATADTFGFDCVCLIKGVLWGWNGDTTKTYGGAKYASNGVPDIGADSMIKVCKNVSTDFSHIEVGEAVWMEGHIGVYVGDGLAVECTPKWKNKVQITACNRSVSGYNRRNWTKHGKLPYVTYEAETAPESKPEPVPQPASAFKKGDLVRITGTKYYSGKNIPGWVKELNWFIHSISGDRAVINKDEKGEHGIMSPVNVADLALVTSTTEKPEPAVTYTTYTVRRGDCLWNIAKKLLGSGSRYTEIKELNGMKNNTIYAGQILKIPKK